MSAVDDLFAKLRESGRKALMPFLTAGDPDVETVKSILKALPEAGADLCEVGIPYSDPIADGPVIQASYQRALNAGFRLEHAMEIGQAVAPNVAMPMVTMVSS